MQSSINCSNLRCDACASYIQWNTISFFQTNFFSDRIVIFNAWWMCQLKAHSWFCLCCVGGMEWTGTYIWAVSPWTRYNVNNTLHSESEWTVSESPLRSSNNTIQKAKIVCRSVGIEKDSTHTQRERLRATERNSINLSTVYAFCIRNKLLFEQIYVAFILHLFRR